MRYYDNWLKAYVQHTRYSESPDSFHFWTGVSTIAGALRRRVWLDMRFFQWTPNFYIILVGPPGVAAKSTSLRAGLGLLEQVPGIHLGPQSVTWQALMDALKTAEEIVDFGTYTEPMSCLTIGVSELGTFFRPDNQEMVDFLTAMWDGQKEVMRRQTRTQGDTTISNPWLNVIGCTTPAWLKENFPDVLIGGGLTSRMVFVFGEKKRQLVAYPSDLITADDYKEEEAHLVADLQAIAQTKGEYKLSPGAKVWGTQWYENLWTGARPPHLLGGKFDGYVSRKQTMLHKLALILAAAKREDLLINEADLIEADQLMTLTEHDLRKVFESIGITQKAKINNDLLGIMRSQRKIAYKELWRICYTSIGQQEFAEGMRAALQAGYIRIDKTDVGEMVVYIGPTA